MGGAALFATSYGRKGLDAEPLSSAGLTQIGRVIAVAFLRSGPDASATSVRGGHIASVRLHSRGCREAFALVVGDELVIGESPLVQVGSLLLHLRLCFFSRCLLLGDAGASLRAFRLLGSLVRRLTVLARHVLSTLSQLQLAGGNSRSLTRPG